MQRKIDVTVAAVIEHDQRFLMVEERVLGALVFNQPAGHLEPGESLLEAAVRETREETGYGFAPQHVLGVYLWRSPETDASVLRVAFCGSAKAPAGTPVLDTGIVAAHWLTRNQLLSRAEQLRSPMVLQCIDDYRAGVRYPLESLKYLVPGTAGRMRQA